MDEASGDRTDTVNGLVLSGGGGSTSGKHNNAMHLSNAGGSTADAYQTSNNIQGVLSPGNSVIVSCWFNVGTVNPNAYLATLTVVQGGSHEQFSLYLPSVRPRSMLGGE